MSFPRSPGPRVAPPRPSHPVGELHTMLLTDYKKLLDERDALRDEVGRLRIEIERMKEWAECYSCGATGSVIHYG